MSRSDVLIDGILREARLISAHRRDDVAEELRAHLDDAADEARRQGLDGDDLVAHVAGDFGDPIVVARQFSRVYRRDRLIAGVAASGGLAIMSLALAGGLVYAVQMWSALSLGFIPRESISMVHLDREGLLLAGLTLGYLGIFLCGRLTSSRFAKPAGLVSLSSLPLLIVVAGWWPTAALLLAAALVCAMVVRAIEIWIAPAAVRYAGLLAFFWVMGGLAHAGMGGSLAASLWLTVLPVCAALALACQCTMSLAQLFDRRVLPRRIV